MKKVTFATLKKHARKGQLRHRIRGQHRANGFQWYIGEMSAPIKTTTLKDLERFKVTKNFIQTDDLTDQNAFAQLSNCCYYINFYLRR